MKTLNSYFGMEKSRTVLISQPSGIEALEGHFRTMVLMT